MALWQMRRATVDEIGAIIEHRSAMFTEMQVGSPERIGEMRPLYETWLTENLPSGHYQHWWAIANDHIGAGAGFGLQIWQPTARDPYLMHAYIDNVYTLPAQRGQGLARQLLQHLITEGRAQNIQVFKLHASAAGQSLYQKLGFQLTNEMRLNLDETQP